MKLRLLDPLEFVLNEVGDCDVKATLLRQAEISFKAGQESMLAERKTIYRRVINLGGSRCLALSKLLPDWHIVKINVRQQDSKIYLTLESADNGRT